MAITWQHLSKRHLCYSVCGVLSGNPRFEVTVWSYSDTCTDRDRFVRSPPQHCHTLHNKATFPLSQCHELVPAPSQVLAALDQKCCLSSSKPSPCVQCSALAAAALLGRAFDATKYQTPTSRGVTICFRAAMLCAAHHGYIKATGFFPAFRTYRRYFFLSFLSFCWRRMKCNVSNKNLGEDLLILMKVHRRRYYRYFHLAHTHKKALGSWNAVLKSCGFFPTTSLHCELAFG